MAKRTVILICLAFVILLLMPIMGAYFYERHAEREFMSIYEEYESEVAQYKLEITFLKQALAALDKELIYAPDSSRFIVGFLVSDASDIQYVRDKAGKYGFSPVIIINATAEESEISSLLATADESWEIMLYVESLADSYKDQISSAKAYLEKIGKKECGVPFARYNSMSNATQAALREAGFVGCTVLHERPTSGQTADGMVYFDYTRIAAGDASFEDRVLQCAKNAASMIYVFDMTSIRAGTLNEQWVETYFNTLSSYTDEEKCSFATVGDVVSELSQINQKREELELAQKEQREAMEGRIREIETIMADIYIRLFGETK